MKLCDYGCGQEAKYKFKNGRWCCEKNISKCPFIRRTNSEKNSGENCVWFGKKHLEETKNKISRSHIGISHSQETRKKLSEINKGKVLSKETRKKMAEAHSGEKNHMYGKIGEDNPNFGSKRSKEFRENISRITKKYFIDSNNRKKHSEITKKSWKKSPNRKKKLKELMTNGGSAYICSFIKNPSKPQVELFELVKSIFPTAVLNYPIYETNNSIDIVIPDKMIAIEYDGSYWHQNRDYDKQRQEQLEDLGWKFIRYLDYIPTRKELLKDVNRI